MTASPYSVTLKRLIEEIGLTEYYMPVDSEEVHITVSDLDRPGLELIGHLDYYDSRYLILFGLTEMSFLKNESHEQQLSQLEPIVSQTPPAMIIARDIEPLPSMMELARKYHVPILTTADNTSDLHAAIVSFLHVELAQRITRHGVLVEVYGEGILLIGDSGVGKSETAIELIKRGHRLIADDAVEIRKVGKGRLVGDAPEMIRYYMELRGIGAVKPESGIDLVVHLEPWQEGKAYDRLGLTSEKENILGVEVPRVTIPVRPGRNLAVILELAAMNNRQKNLGYNAAEALAAEHDLAIDAGQF